MLEEGIVVDIKDGAKASVVFERKSSCGICCACSMAGSGKMHIEAYNPVRAKSGDRVKLEVKTKGLVSGVILIYLLPALGLILGIVFGSRLSKGFSLAIGPETFGILLGATLMLFFFIIARHYGTKNTSYSAQILEILG